MLREQKKFPEAWNEWIVSAFGASGGGLTWTTEGYKHMAGSTGRRVVRKRSRHLARQRARAAGVIGVRHQPARWRALRIAPLATSRRRPFGLPVLSSQQRRPVAVRAALRS